MFIAHFGPAGVTAAKLRELGVLRGKIATIFHGIDISSREVLSHYTPEYQQLFRRGDLMLPISELWAGRLKSMGCPPEKIAVSRMGRRHDAFYPSFGESARDAAGDDFRRAPDRKKRPACGD
ncbi:colanic acid biosynthesis glycosyltransferase WcaL [Salmonella enterica subsp. enterica serovar Derby]|nr:colanic acid biosynthesis glycosyltransferase WcaL [Salmonella enterica subsp. enterica serovar Derby]